jgi:AcrR family transcriptional regulator
MLERDGAAALPPDDGAESVVRRAPFATSPFVGARGVRAQQRIVEAALQVFGEVGYHECGVKRITEVSGCSRASFYQYFSSKEDLFRHLAGRVARLLAASTGELGPITGDKAGWDELHGWLVRYSALYDAHEPVFTTFQTAATSDETVASGAARVAVRTFSGIRSQIQGSVLASRLVDGVVRTLLDSVARVNRVAELLEGASLGGGAAARDRVDRALADVMHRTLFGVDASVNVHEPAPVAASAASAALPREPVSVDAELRDDGSLGPGARRTRALLIETGHKVFAEKGYYATRVADVVAAAGVSHGVFYRYFDNKTQLFRILAERASERLRTTLAEIPPITGRAGSAGSDHDDDAAELREWLRQYAATSAEEAAITAMWSEAMSRDETLGAVSAAAIEGFRQICARFLAPRGFGDVEAEAIVLLVLIDAMTASRAASTPGRIETVAQLVERGLLTPPP